MKKKLTTLLASLALASALAIPMAMVAQTPATGTQEAPKAKPQRREKHPAIRQAIRMLDHAKAVLQKEGAHDFGGHRVKAIQEIDEGLAQLHLALQYDKK